jgi:HK97 gp10 family phage protein
MPAEIKGLDQVLRNLKELPVKIRVKPLRRAVGKGAAVIKRAAKRNALRIDDPSTGRRIADNIGQRLRSGLTRRTGDVTVSVGVLSERGRIPKGNPDTGPRGNTPHWHLVELGVPSKNIAAQPYLRPSASENTQQVFDAVANSLQKEIDKEVTKLRK